MDFRKEAIGELGQYNARKLSVLSLEKKIRELEGRIDLATDDLQESYRFKKHRLEAQLSWVKFWLESIDYCLMAMTDSEREILEVCFMSEERGRVTAFATERGVTMSGMYKQRDKALSRFVSVMFGG